MPKINVLPQHEACKIAAGEVVERPANVVKELVENSIDAGASLIEIHLKKSGKEQIRIVDNGCGMSHQDAKLCFEHHATSKIKTIADLQTISSFGFRGEALSSISAVSKVVLATAEQDAECGTKVVWEGGKLASQSDSAGAVGTDILVQDLFYNIPARQKFLKKDETEWRQIVQLYQAFVFDYPAIHFRLYSEERLVYNCPPVQCVKARVMQIWDHDVSDNLLDINAKSDKGDISISGVISNHQVFKYNRNHIFFFVNHRLVKNYELSRALIKGYANVLPEGRSPAAVLFLEVSSDDVDVNVHPRKEEVQFLYSRRVENFIRENTKKVLEDALTSFVRPQGFNSTSSVEMSLGGDSPATSNFKAARSTDYDFDSFLTQSIETPISTLSKLDFGPSENINLRAEQNSFASQVAQAPQAIGVVAVEQAQQKSFVQRNYEIIGQFNQTYILISKEEGLLIVDQHAAHERVLYELFKNRFSEVATVNLMFPTTITMSPPDLEVLKPHLSILDEHGLTVEYFGEDQLIVQSTPTYLKHVKLDELINELVAWIKEYQELDVEMFRKNINEKMHAQMACKAAVKAGDILASEQMYELIDDLEKSENKLTCPHGRPTFWHFSLHDIEKKFKRKT